MSDEREIRIKATFDVIADDIKLLRNADGDLSTLTTVTKANLVAAINEVRANASVGALIAANNLSDIVDAATGRTNLDVLSVAQVAANIATAVDAVTLAGLGGLTEAEVDARANAALAASIGTAPAVLDTIQEIAAQIADDDSEFMALTTAVSNKVSFSTVQSLTTAQKLQASQNIGLGNPDFDFLASYTAIRDA